ncbi:MAG: ATP-binding protein, partial [Prochloraceae cyanobacterium]|nr:ATP-binding protein [Prochloraceae cyanobacterium]
MQALTQQPINQPYKGLEPFDESDAPIFFGREKDRDRIVNYLRSSRLTVLYGTSGVGKSSVLRAGVTYYLRQAAQQNLKRYGVPKFAVVVLKDWREDPLGELIEQIKDESEKLLDGQKLPIMSPTRNLKEVLQVCTKFLGEEGEDGTLLIVLDQFEEYFLYHPQPEEGERTFEIEFPKAVNCLGLGVNFLISIREDWIAQLDRFKVAIPNILDNRLELKPLDEQSACDAILNPVYKVYNRQHKEGRISIEPELVERILAEIALETWHQDGHERSDEETTTLFRPRTFQSSYLQVLMQHLWKEEMKNESHQLRLKTLEKLGGAKEVLKNYFKEEMEWLSKIANPKWVNVVAKFVNYLVTPSGTKIAYPSEDLAVRAEIEERELRLVLEELVKQHLLNPVISKDNPNLLCYELSHDILAPVILEWHNDYWKNRNRTKLEAIQNLSQVDIQAWQEFLD